ncbi:MAG: hypothetical protein KY469_22870, partial [Actinobacteria bacterium]|nr:hypothetical protein [Actinomycetota bacterium]
PPTSPARSEAAPRLRDLALAGAFLVGASTLQGEFDYAVPQFRLLYQPVLLMFAAGVALVPARIRLGRGGALGAVLVFLGIRVLLTVLITPVLGRTAFHFPLYLGAAVAVELVALRVPVHRQLTFGAWAGLGIGTLGLAVEWAWSHVGMPIAWPAALLPEALLALPAAVAAAVVGGFIGRSLTPADHRRQDVAGWVAPVAGAVLVFTLAYPMPMTTAPGASVEATLEDVEEDPEERTVHARIRLHPTDLAEDADYFNITAWQGAEWTRESSFLDPLERIEPGVYRTTRPIPVHGEWKALIRIQKDRLNIAAPIFLPEDEAIPAEEVPAEQRFTREFDANRKLLLREAKEAPAWIDVVAYGGLAVLLLTWIASIGWGLSRLRRSGSRSPVDSGHPADETTGGR